MAVAYAVEKPAELWETDENEFAYDDGRDYGEQHDWDEGDESHLTAGLVEIHGLEDDEEVWSAPPAGHAVEDFESRKTEGRTVNGKAGRARYLDHVDDAYAVDLLEGGSFWIVSKHLKEYEQPHPEAGGFDVPWPDLETSDLSTFGLKVCEALQVKGYCLIKTFNTEEASNAMVSKANDRADWKRPMAEFEEAYLGKGAKSVMSPLAEEATPGDAANAYMQSMSDLSSVLAPFSGESLGFTLSPFPAQDIILRRRAEPGDQQSDYEAGSDEMQSAQTEQFIQFIQDRRLCVMSLVRCENGATVELNPRHQNSGLEHSIVPVAAGMMIAFRQDWFSYSYKPEGPDLVVQGWLMQMRSSLEIDRVEGSRADVLASVNAGGQAVNFGHEVRIMSMSAYLCGSTLGFGQIRTMYTSATDGLVEIPQSRWNHDLYYSDRIEDGLSVCKHTGFINDDNFFTFDPELMGYTLAEAKTFTTGMMKQLEIAYDMLHQVGKTKENMKGERFYWTICDSVRDPGLSLTERWEKSISNPVLTVNDVVVPSFLAYHFGTHGVTQMIDTACSASGSAFANLMQELKSSRDSSKGYRISSDFDYTQGAVGGNLYANHPAPYIGMSQARMLGKLGRSVTFDMSANGFIRGESFTGLYLKRSTDDNDALEQLAAAVGAATNQDGKSASLTAPNGPSQTKCVQIAQRDINRHPFEVCITELHGTGTALGDPIETGSTRALMVGRQTRPTPLPHTAGKSTTGHTELSSGANGLIRSIINLYAASVTPNVHVRQLNSNIEYIGYPAMWSTESVDMGIEVNYGGINSFGFGGTNVRMELAGFCKSGPRKRANMALRSTGELVMKLDKKPDAAFYGGFSGLNPEKVDYTDKRSGRSYQSIDTAELEVVLVECPKCAGPMCWLCKEAHTGKKNKYHRCSQVRTEAADYAVCSECYEGDYLIGKPEESYSADRSVYIVPSWTSFQPVEMTQTTNEEGELQYSHKFFLGKDRQPSFSLSLETKEGLFFHPAKDQASQNSRIIGPTGPGDKINQWAINADEDGASQGEQYEICFFWSPKKKTLKWQHINATQMLGDGTFGSWAGNQDARSSEATEQPNSTGDDDDESFAQEDWMADYNEQTPGEEDYTQSEEYFSICSMSKGFYPSNMSWSEYGDAHGDADDLWEAYIKIGSMGWDEFYIVRNEDFSRAICPAEEHATSTSVPILVNTSNVPHRSWVVQGSPGSYATVQMRLKSHDVMLRIIEDGGSERVWQSEF